MRISDWSSDVCSSDLVTANAKATYGDRSDKWNGEFSALISKTFDTPAGRFGLMADYARSHVVTRTESVIMDKIRTYCSAGAVNPDGDRKSTRLNSSH